MIKQATSATIAKAAALLKDGQLVAFPTETVFGLGADATNSEAVTALYTLKNRPSNNPFSIMIPDLAMAQRLGQFDARALTLAHTLWPGPLSIVVPIKHGNGLSPVALAGKTSISLRLPKQPTALALLKAAELPLAVPSANLSGSLSTTHASDVARDMGQYLPIILADNQPTIGIESTLIDLTTDTARILRLGAVSQQEIETLIGPVAYDAPQAKPYTMKTPLRLNAIDVKPGEAFLGFGNLGFVGVQGVGFVHDLEAKLWRNLSPQGDLHEAAANLYTMLDELDQAGATTIAVMRLPEDGLGIVLNDRLRRAAAQ